MTTMQNVAWPTTTVNRPRLTLKIWVKVSLSASPVTIPGRAIGRMTRNEIVSRPKKRCRDTAKEARVPSTRAIAVAASPTLIEVWNAARAPLSPSASPNHLVVRPSSGHVRVVPALKA